MMTQSSMPERAPLTPESSSPRADSERALGQFHQFGLRPQLLQALDELEHTDPTPIQSAIIPALLAGHDVIGQAQTGTGKTGAFSLPILNSLDLERHFVQGLVLAPTRELAMQVAAAIHAYGRHLGVRVLAVYGGQPYGRQISRLKKGVDLVIGTPGRLLDLIDRGVLDLSQVSTVVLDEADEMLSMGFIEDIGAILDVTPTNRQTALLSATMPAPIRSLAQRYMHDPQFFAAGPQERTVARTEQRYYLVNAQDKLAALSRLFEIEPITGALIFVRTRLATGDLANALASRGVVAEMLNGDMSQEARTRVMQRFREGQIQVLVATDVAARGLDIDDISHVFNFDLPLDPELYVHRIGRTGRAGREGVAISLVTPSELWRLRKIETYTRQSITEATVPTAEDIQAFRDQRLAQRLAVWLRRGRSRRERHMVRELVETGYDPVEIAAAALKLVRTGEQQRPIEPMSEVRFPQPRRSPRARDRNQMPHNGRGIARGSHEKGMVRLSLSTGKAHGVRVGHVVGSLAHYADIPGRALGKIRVEEHQTFVDVPEELVGRVLSQAGTYRIGRQAIDIQRA